VLARGPRDVERRRSARDEAPAASALRRATICRVCGGDHVDEDEVNDRGIHRLLHCRRCEARWTERVAASFRPLVRRPIRADRIPRAEGA